MLRLPLIRATGLSNGRFGTAAIHTSSSKSQSQELIEVFIDDKPVHVPPGTTVLQVPIKHLQFELKSRLSLNK